MLLTKWQNNQEKLTFSCINVKFFVPLHAKYMLL